MSRALVANAVKIGLVLVIALGAAVPTAFATFIHSERTVAIGAHTATVSPTFDGHATLDFGPVLPRLRVPSSQGSLGVAIDVGDSEVGNLNELIVQDAVIASQPEGEIAKVTSTVRSMGRDALLRGAGVAVLMGTGVVAVWKLIGRSRRRALMVHIPTRRGTLTLLTASLTAVVGLALIYWPEEAGGQSDVEDETWTSIYEVFPSTPESPVLDTVEVSEGGASRGGSAIVEGAIETYQTSVNFYGKLRDEAESVVVRQPEEGEMTALVVTDRHNNIGMDPVARAVADAAGASMVIDLGDDTSSGGAWEDFSINSLARAFDGMPVAAIAGNHDTGPFVLEAMRAQSFEVLDGAPADVSGIRMIGASDPRGSGLTAGYSGDEADSIAAIGEQDEALTDAACADGEVTTALVHSPSTAKKLAASGCVDLILSGHLHRQVGPEVIAGPDGERTVTFSGGSTGGAVYAFALGSKLRRPAQVSIVTFEGAEPVGIQPVDFDTSGEVVPADYIDFSTLAAVDSPPSDDELEPPTPEAE